MIKKLFIIIILLMVFFLGFWIAFVKTIKMGVIKVPNVTGKSLEDAEKILKSKNLEYILDTSLSGYSEKIKQGHILKQEPKENSTIKGGGPLRLGLSLGASRITIPDLTKKHYYEAELYLKSQNLKLGNVSYIDFKGDESIILSQFPPPNSMAPPDISIDLLVSKPKNTDSYIMSNFLSSDYEYVLSELTALGFKVEKPREIKIPHYDTGIILSQSPLPGTKITKKTPIIFTINTGI